jgi:hypothetical protein
VRKYLLTGLLLCPMAYADALPSVPVQNLIEECVDVKASAPYTIKGKAYVEADLKMLQVTAHCGCTSKVAAYSLLNENGTTLFHARFDLTRSEKKKLNLGDALKLGDDVSLRIGSAGAP